MYKINFSENEILLNWNIIYWGITKNLIPPSSAIEYAHKLVEVNPNEENAIIVELLILDDIEKEKVLSLVEKLSCRKTSKETENIRVLRYIVLKDLKQRAKSNGELLTLIEQVYSDFDYPKDMNNFISYMPVENDDYDTSIHSLQQNEQRLIDNFNDFLKNELIWIKETKKDKKGPSPFVFV